MGLAVVGAVGEQRRSTVLLGLLALVAAGACAGNAAPASTGATVPKVAPTTIAADPYAVPAKIDEAYLNKVFAALEHVDGDATRLIVAGQTLVPEAAKRLRAIYAEDEFQAQVNLWLDIVIKKDLGRSKPNPGDRRTTVSQVLTATPGCIYAAVNRDYSAIVDDSTPSAEFVGLKPSDPARDSFNLNPTPWMVFFDGSNKDGSTPSDPCV